MSYGLAFQLIFYSRDGVVTLSDSIDANPAFGDCSEPGESIEAALREVRALVVRPGPRAVPSSQSFSRTYQRERIQSSTLTVLSIGTMIAPSDGNSKNGNQ